MPRRVELLVPTGIMHTQALPLAPRPADLRGRVIGLLDNGKSNTAPFMARLAERLAALVPGVTIVSQTKPTAARPAAGEPLELLAQRCDVVVNGIADWGSCTSWSVHDSVALEQRGVPTVTVLTEAFTTLYGMESRALGMPDLPATLIPPRSATARVADLAVCAVMAGCAPRCFPVVVTALEAALEPRFNLFGAQGTTNSVAPPIVANGPLARDLEIHAGVGLFGPGWPVNATIGRAVRLVLLAIGGGQPGVGDKSTLGRPAKYSFCIAGHEAASPWAPLHVERGLPAETSALTLSAGAAPQNVIDKSRTPQDVLLTLGQALVAVGSSTTFMANEALLVLGPEHAGVVARAGWSKAEVRERIWAAARFPLDALSGGNQDVVRAWRPDCLFAEDGAEDGRTYLRALARPEDLSLAVAGGDGNHAAVIAGWYSRSVTLPIALPNGAAARTIEAFRSAAREVRR